MTPTVGEQLRGLLSREELQRLEDAREALQGRFYDQDWYATPEGISPALDREIPLP